MRKMILSAAVLLVSASLSHAKVVCGGFLPPNSMRIPVGDVHAKGINEAFFNRVLDHVQEIYGPIIAKRGAHLVINRLWEDPTVNASAEEDGTTWILNMYGGLARHPAVTMEGFALVACHELGHHLGGYPLVGGDDWATNEGGADYFATLKCMRRVLPGLSRLSVDPTAVKSCAAAYSASADRSACEQSAMAGISLATLLAGNGTMPSLDTPDRSVVNQTNDAHPAAQCRLDTYFQGALCTKPVNEEQSRTDPAAGACTFHEGYAVGLRPLCWYRPPMTEVSGVFANFRPAPLNEKALQESLSSMRDALLGGGR